MQIFNLRTVVPQRWGHTIHIMSSRERKGGMFGEKDRQIGRQADRQAEKKEKEKEEERKEVEEREKRIFSLQFTPSLCIHSSDKPFACVQFMV